jgi:protein-disulfide isomerase
MTSGKAARKQRQAARPPTRSTEGRSASPKVLAGIAIGLVGIGAAVLLAVVAFGGGDGDTSVNPTTLPDANVIARQLQGIPQRGNVLGKASAPVTLVEYIDLQCPICRQFETEVMPTIIDRYVRTGKVKVEARPIAFIGEDSVRGRNAMIAAGLQNRAFDFSQLLYFNQGPENGGWLDDDMVASAATSIPGVNVQQVLDDAESSRVEQTAARYDDQATADNVGGTPTVLVGKSDGELSTTGADLESLSAALDRALR